jgi:outer membrane protein assembly factor BamB
MSTPALGFGHLYVSTQYDHLVALDLATGEEAWRHGAGEGVLHDAHARSVSSSFPSSPVLAGDVLWVIGGDGVLRALDPASGRSRWAWDLGLPGHGGIAVAGDYLVVATFDGTVRVLYESNCALPADDGGCGCQAGSRSQSGPIPCMLLALLLARRRRPVV